ncbi:hypothetical protein FRC17_000150 [Serendipita sp. 399]|nr:hypothetical protein FRC17_000150 [Serendipita sp. 399]
MATVMANDLGRVQQAWVAVDQQSIERAIPHQFSHTSHVIREPKHLDKYAKRRECILSSHSPTIIDPKVFGELLSKHSGVPKKDGGWWRKHLAPLLQIYEQMFKILETRTAYTSAYEDFYMLYESELHSANSGANPVEYPESHAQTMAKLKVGMTPPRASSCFKVEGIRMTIDVRFAFGALAERVYSHLVSQPEKNQAQIGSWGDFAVFIYDTCIRDADIASKIASSMQAHRQGILTGLRIIQAEWRLSRLLIMTKQSQGGTLSGEERKRLAEVVEKRLAVQKEYAATIQEVYERNCKFKHYISKKEFDVPLRECFKHWEELIMALKRLTMSYETVSAELPNVVSSSKEDSDRGRWYTCPNGHIFTINDYGDTILTNCCYECGATMDVIGRKL